MVEAIEGPTDLELYFQSNGEDQGEAPLQDRRALNIFKN